MSDSTIGTTILDMFPIGIEKDDTEMVLVKRSDTHTPFVIWSRFKATEESGYGAYTYTGHYFSRLTEAVDFFEHRRGELCHT
jgi:hypothetical protein